ncbi:MAG: sulfatase-like hydrolase/transferase [Acidobacteria bacterium]|nr:sulfatase-like hydrolase/transferase [Acidobacteriota bacterium]
MITVDTLRADRLGCYGYKQIQTPALDGLAHDGVVFERAIAPVPLTWPSHVALFTGTYPFSNGVQDFTGQTLSPEFRTLTESLRQQGYATGAVVSAFVLDRSWGLARGFDHYYDVFPAQAFGQKDLGLVDRRAEASVEQALKWLETLPRQPFFLWLHLFDPHSPYDAPEPFRSRYRNRPYDGEVAYADHHLGRLLEWLKQRDLYDRTLVVFLSDHGESLGAHGEAEHGFFVYNATVWVPLIIKPPAGSGVKPRRVAAPVETIRVAPTVLRLAGVQDDPIQKQFQAASLVALMAQGRESGKPPAYAETFYPFSSFGWSPLRSLQTERYHYIEAPEPELYDLRADPQEKNNRAPQEKTQVAALRAQVQALLARYPRRPPGVDTSGLDPESIEKLRSLGYVAYRAPTGAKGRTSGLSDPKHKLEVYNSILQATDALHAGDETRGQALLEKVQQSEPELYLIPFLLGEAASRQGKWEAAGAEFARALKLNPDFDQAMMGLGRALSHQGKPEAAQQWLKQALALNPRNFRAWFELGQVQMRQDTPTAMASLEKTLSIQPNFAPARRALGLLGIKQGDYAAAARNLAQAVELGVTDPATYNYLGIAYSRSGEFERAVESYQQALAGRPDFAEAHLNLAYAYQRLNRLAAAQREYETACRLEKEFCQYVSNPPQ